VAMTSAGPYADHLQLTPLTPDR